MLLSLVFLVLALGCFALVTYWPYASQSPLPLTRVKASREIMAAVSRTEANPNSNALALLKESPDLQKIASVNDRFRYFARVGTKDVEFGPNPRHLGSIPALRALLENDDPERSSGILAATKMEKGVRTTIMFRIAVPGRASFVEISGIDTAVEGLRKHELSSVNFWLDGRDALIAGAGVLVIATILFAIATRSLRTLARAARSLDTRTSERQLLPEEGLPTEVGSLVGAINQMIRRVAATRDEQEMFLAAAAHELCNPMAALRMRLEELQQSEHKDTLRADVNRMVKLVDQMLQLMHTRNNRELPDQVDLVSAARDVVAERAPLSVDHGVDIQFDSETTSLVLRGHKQLATVAIANVVDNAISFSRPGDTIWVSVDTTGGVAVRDCGPGIPATELERIFEPFAKSPPNRHGHGLGLAIVKAVMDAHGGDVSAVNAEGGGVIFALCFRGATPVRTT